MEFHAVPVENFTGLFLHETGTAILQDGRTNILVFVYAGADIARRHQTVGELRR